MKSPAPRFFAVVPAAGVGFRLGSIVPKQYLMLAGRTVLERSLDALVAADWIDRIVVVTARGDSRASELLRGGGRLVVSPVGGATRRDSVLAGLAVLEPFVDSHDWVLVHDAARPGLSVCSLDALRTALRDDPVGGLLAVSVADTVKRAGAHARVEGTLPREELWLAQTPQMFRFGLLHAALRAHPHVTDESEAIEAAGHSPKLVAGERRNFKVTTAEDLELMAAIFTRAKGLGQLR